MGLYTECVRTYGAGGYSTIKTVSLSQFLLTEEEKHESMKTIRECMRIGL